MPSTATVLSARDRLIPWYFVMFFVVLAAVDGVMVTLAINTHTGVVTDHAYEKGLAYNQVISDAERQTRLGWKGEIDFSAAPDRTGNYARMGNLSFRLTDNAGNTVPAQAVTATIIRPVQAGMDFSAPLTPRKNGDFGATVKFPLSGLWQVQVTLNAEGETFTQTKRIVVP